ncbi:hypothetical protein L6252_01315, partial [Candidatus Parcubacteria bacterium]|nr:hypothetical protein [Candidatus Parcubacteria bacterium]
SLRYMTITMNDSHIISIAQIEEFIKVDQAIKFKAISKKEKYLWIDNVLTKFKHLPQEMTEFTSLISHAYVD